MAHSIGRIAMAQVQSLLYEFLQDGALPFSSVLTVQDIVDLISQTCVETCDRIFTPVVTLCTFLRQIHSDDPSCRAAVARLNATRVAQGLEPCSPLTGGYCTRLGMFNRFETKRYPSATWASIPPRLAYTSDLAPTAARRA